MAHGAAGLTIVLYVGEEDIDAGTVFLGGHGAGHFQKDAYTAGTIIGPVDGFVLTLVIAVRERACVPVCEKQDPVLRFGAEAREDVA